MRLQRLEGTMVLTQMKAANLIPFRRVGIVMDAVRNTLDLTSAKPARFPLKLAIMHLCRNRHVPDLENPRTFNELVQARKLHDRNPLLPLLADKVSVKEYVARRLGDEWVIPTLWHGTVLSETPDWPLPFVLKSSHASCQCAFVRTGREDWPRIRRQARRWLGRSYGKLFGEWLYDEIPPRLLVEPFIGSGGTAPPDYKFFVFGGRAEFVQVDTDREHAHKRIILDRNWQRLPVELQYPTDPRDAPRPASFEAMMQAAETLSRGFDFVRVDMYEVEGKPLFGEMTFYPGSGLDRFRPAAFDALFGEYWLAARRRSPSW